MKTTLILLMTLITSCATNPAYAKLVYDKYPAVESPQDVLPMPRQEIADVPPVEDDEFDDEISYRETERRAVRKAVDFAKNDLKDEITLEPEEFLDEEKPQVHKSKNGNKPIYIIIYNGDKQ
jgi:hypothetical protein